jgi:hypothetical protein
MEVLIMEKVTMHKYYFLGKLFSINLYARIGKIKISVHFFNDGDTICFMNNDRTKLTKLHEQLLAMYYNKQITNIKIM